MLCPSTDPTCFVLVQIFWAGTLIELHLHSDIIFKHGVDLHIGEVFSKDVFLALTKLLMAFKEMDEKFGFKIIDYMPNGCVSKKEDTVNQKYHSYFDIILMKK